jgi:hypothetical protein
MNFSNCINVSLVVTDLGYVITCTVIERFRLCREGSAEWSVHIQNSREFNPSNSMIAFQKKTTSKLQTLWFCEVA